MSERIVPDSSPAGDGGERAGLQFRLRTVFYATTVFAVGCAIGLIAYERLLQPAQRQRRCLRSIASVVASPSRELALQMASRLERSENRRVPKGGTKGVVELAIKEGRRPV